MSEKPSDKAWELIPSLQDPTQQEGEDLSTRTIAGATPKPDLSTRPVGGKREARAEGRLQKDTLLQKRYRILGVIGSGGMSTVYKSQDMRFPKVTRLCAAKEMLNTSNNPEIRARNLRNFEREASILATLNHPSIPQVYDYFTEGDHSYLVMEFIKGQDLEALLSSIDAFPPEAKVISWAIQTCEVLIYLHSHKPDPIVFRDVKPSNIMIDEHSRVRLVDFGIAKVFQSGLKGTMIGTEGYSPPEQYRGIADPRGDLYALGATLHHLLSRQDPRLEPPFSFHERPIHEANPTVSDELVEIIERALEYDIDRRYTSAEEMHEVLSKLGRGRGVPLSPLTSTAASIIPAGGPQIMWEFKCEDEVRSTPIVENGTVFIGAYDHNLYALDDKTGKFKWKYPTDGGIGSSPAYFQGLVFVGSQDQSLYAINAETGGIRWTCPTSGPIYSSPKTDMGMVFFGSDDAKLYAVKMSSGRVAWKLPLNSAIRSSPALGEQRIFVGDESGMLYGISTAGEISWRFRTRHGLTASPLLIDNTIYIGSQDGYFYAVDTESGWDVWRFRTSSPIISTASTDGKNVFFGSADGFIYSLNMMSGRLNWRFEAEAQITSSPAYHEGAIYIGSTEGCLFSIDAEKGKRRWRFDTEGPIISSPCVYDNVVYFGSCDHRVYALPV